MKPIHFSLQEALAGLNINQLNPMQEAARKSAKEHQNLVLLSATGSGKTLGFLIPLLDKLNDEPNKTKALIIAPTRELVLQIEQVCRSLKTGFKVSSFYGGHSTKVERNSLLHPATIVIGTPGRIADHISRKSLNTDDIESIVLDEFDKSLELGFHQEMEYIISELPFLKNRFLTSATDLKELPGFLNMTNFEKLNFIGSEATKRLTVKLVYSKQADKLYTFLELLCNLDPEPTVVFCNHRDAVERIHHFLKERDVPSEFFHGGLEQDDRERILCKFRNGSNQILITTDLAARGLDIPEIKHVIHYQLPPKEDAFIHRNGRTARVEAHGTAYLIVAPDEEPAEYIPENTEVMDLVPSRPLPPKPAWQTLFIGAGKKDKVNKIDVVGFLSKVGELGKDDIGLIEVKDFFCYVAIKRNKTKKLLELIRDQKIKGKKHKISISK